MAWFFGNKQQKYIDNLEKNNKKRQEKEREEAEIITIGKATPEQQEERASQVVAQRNQKRMEAIEEEQEKEDKAQEDQLFVINGAKVKFGPHIGTFKVLSDTPTIQSKTVGTEIEKKPANFTFMDGFQLLTLTQWQEVGTAKYQDNLALIKKSTIVSTGKMSPANAPIESGKIEFIDSGQINVPENIDTTGMPLPLFNQTIEKSEYSLESNYFHNHLLEVAKEVMSNIDEPDSYVYKFYKKVIENQIKNPEIEVVKDLFSDKWGKYDSFSEKIQISEKQLADIEKDNDRKIQLITVLGECYAKYIEGVVENLIDDTTILDLFEYEFLRFDGFGNTCNIPIAKLTTPQKEIHTLNICLEVPEEILQDCSIESSVYDDMMTEIPSSEPRQGDSAFPTILSYPTPPPPETPILPNIGFKFSMAWKGNGTPACSFTVYAGLQKEVAKDLKVPLIGPTSVMIGLNLATTLYQGTPGTSDLSPQLATLSASPSLTIGSKTGNSCSLNLFNQYTGAGVYNPYKYAFSLGVTGVLSTGDVSKNFDEEGNLIKDEYNTHDHNHRHQILGGAAIKAGNFIIASYNDVCKFPFFGINSDQNWSAGANIKFKLRENLNFSYAFDLYYGKSSNKRPLNKDVMIDGQNYDLQNLFELTLNRGQETFTMTDDYGKVLGNNDVFGYGCFWPSNNMHNAITWPEKPPQEPKRPLRSDYIKEEDFEKAKADYAKKMRTYRRDLNDYNLSQEITDKTKYKYPFWKRPFKTNGNERVPNPTFHWLFSIYNKNNKIDWERVKEYFNAKQAQDIYLNQQNLRK